MTNTDGLPWRCKHEQEGERMLCPTEGCPKSYGCARDKGWKPGDPTPNGCVGLPKQPVT
jgi:hypothetical protein